MIQLVVCLYLAHLTVFIVVDLFITYNVGLHLSCVICQALHVHVYIYFFEIIAGC